jgi:uncharacterized membrane protein
VLNVPATEAHEIGTTKVTVHLQVASPSSGGTYRIDIETDADALLEKLEAIAGRPATRAARELTAREFTARLAALESTFRERVAVAFEGAESRPAVTFDVTPPASDLEASAATIRLTGSVPPGHARFVWRYAWTFATYALRIAGRDDAHTTTVWLEGGESSSPYDVGLAVAPVSRPAIARQYLELGLTHIVPHGLDHVLFVLGLFLLSTRWRSVLWQVSAFTLAHSITLGLGMYGVIGAPPAIVEPLIALSIAIVAVENVLRSELHPWRVALVFAFGLLHGMGFAGALTDLGLPRGEFVTALVGFNVGVECGQLLVIAAAFAVVGWYQGQPAYRGRVVVPASLAIAGVAIFWTIERAAVMR